MDNVDIRVEVRPVEEESLLLLLVRLQLGLVLGDLLQQLLFLVVPLHAAVRSVTPKTEKGLWDLGSVNRAQVHATS